MRLRIAGLIALAGTSGILRAQERTPFPAFTGARVYTAEVPASFDDLKPVISRLEHGTKQTYYVVYVQSFGRGSNAAIDYVNDLFRHWRVQATARKLPLDDQRSVIIAVALGDHKIGVHPGTVLGGQLGLRGRTLDEELIRRKFIPYAELNRPLEATISLLEGIDAWIKEREGTSVALSRSERSARGSAAVRPPSGDSRNITPPAVVSTSRVSARWLGIGFAVLVLFAGGVMVFLVHRSRTRARGKLQQLLKDYRARSVEVMDRLDALKESLKKLPACDPDFKAPLVGETLALYQSLERSLGRLWDQWLAAMDALDQAGKLVNSAGSAFDHETLKKVEALLDSGRAFDPVDEGAKACRVDFERLDQAHEQARAIAERIEASTPKIAAAAQALTALGYPTLPFQQDEHQAQAEYQKLKLRLTSDPVGLIPRLESLAQQLQGVLDRLERGRSIHADASQERARLAELTKQVADYRSGGLALKEPGGDPDRYLAETGNHLQLLKAALREGDVDRAEHELEQAKAMNAQAATTIEEVKQAKAFCLIEQAARRRAAGSIEALLAQCEISQRRLEAEFAAESWSGVAHYRDQARGLLQTFEPLLAEISRACDSQRFLAARRVCEELARRQAIATSLLEGVKQRLDELTAARTEAQGAMGELETRTHTLASKFRAQAQILGPMAHEALERAANMGREIRQLSAASRPDWQRILDLVHKATAELAIVADQAEEDLRRHDQLVRQFASLRRKAQELQIKLASRAEDRLAANQHLQSATQILDQIGTHIDQPRGESASLIEALRGASEDLDRADQLFHEDLRVAAQAQSEIAEADRSIRQARAYFSMGVGVDCTAAQQALIAAQNLFSNQDYEQAVEQAARAIQLSRAAYNTAVQQAAWRSMQQQADLRRWNASAGWNSEPGLNIGTIAAAAAASAILNQVANAASQATNPAEDSGAAAAAWTSSDDGQGSW